MPKPGLIIAGAIVALSVAWDVAPVLAQPATQPGDIRFEMYELDNGLRVILAPDPASTAVAVNLWYNVGSRVERPGRSGSGLTPGTRTYRFVIQDNPIGTLTSRLERDGDVWVATSTIQSPVMAQESEVRFTVSDMTPISSRSEIRQGEETILTDLQFADGRVTGRLELPEQLGGARDVDSEVPAGTLLPGMDGYVIEAADLAEGRSIALPIFEMMSGAVTTLTLQVAGTETVDVPAGTFAGYRVELTGGPQAMTMVVRQDAPHIMLVQEFVGAPVLIELESTREP